MDAWHCVAFQDRAALSDAARLVLDAHMRAALLRAAAGRPPGADFAVFARTERGTDGGTIYFPPGTLSLAVGLQARPCAKPLQDGLTLLAGVHDSKHAYYPA